MTQFRVIATVAITGLVGVMPAAAQGKSGSHGGSATTHGRPATATATTTTSTTSTVTTHGKSGDVTHGKSGDVTHGKSAAVRGTSDTDGDKSPRKSITTSSTTSTTTATGTNALATKISSKPNQLARITAMLPAGMTLDQATAGFRNQGQFIAALNASKNQGVSFVDLQKAMTVDGLSLGQAVRQLKPTTTNTDTTEGTKTTTGTNSTGDTTTGTTTTSTTSTTTKS